MSLKKFLIILLACFIVLWFVARWTAMPLTHFFSDVAPYHPLLLDTISAVVVLSYLATFVILGSRLARRRGRNPVTWGIICALTGVWGWIFLYFMKANGFLAREDS